MRIGPITVRWTVDVEAEQAKLAKSRAVSAKVTDMLLLELRRYKGMAYDYCLEEGLIDRGASEKAKPPKAGVASL